MAILLMAGKCNSGNCDQLALVSDQSGLDGCGLLLRVENGVLLLPTNLDEYDLKLDSGDTVSISYEVIPDAISVCMRESASIRLTCIEMYSQ